MSDDESGSATGTAHAGAEDDGAPGSEAGSDESAEERPPQARGVGDVKGMLEEAGLNPDDVRTGAFDVVEMEEEAPAAAVPPKPYEQSDWRVDDSGTAFRRGTAKYPNGDIYEGEFVNGKRHGNGQFLYRNGDKYIGEFVAGKYEGFGVMANADFKENGVLMIGRRYQGMFRDGLKEGEGLYIVGNGDVYEGEFFKGKFGGKGKYKYHTGAVYDGDWEAGMWHGVGKLRFMSGDIYRGEFKDGRMHGKGLYKWRKRTGTYKGTFRFNKRHGHGRRTFVNGAVYEGEYHNNTMSGEGVYRMANGDIYIGTMRDDRFHGNGTLQTALGDKYVGQFQKGVFCGRGRYEFSDGGFYDGDYFAIRAVKKHSIVFPKYDGKRHGKGVRVWANGNRYEGEWQDDAMTGFGVATGMWLGIFQVYEGQFAANRRTGRGVCVYGNSDRVPFFCMMGNRHDGRKPCTYDGEWLLDRFNGQGVYTCGDGRKYEGEWRHGKRHGKGKQVLMAELHRGAPDRMFIRGASALYRPECYEGEWVKDKREGRGLLVFENGDTAEGLFVGGHLHGAVTFTFKRGNRRRGALYERGVRVRWLTHEEEAADRALQILQRNLAGTAFARDAGAGAYGP